MKIVFNSSPLIFLSQLDFLELFLQYDYQFYVPKVVINEINAKQDEASNYVNVVVANNSLIVKQINLFSLANSINERLGRGEAEAIALATELQSDYVILDDFAARREAMRLGLNVKGTLAIIKKMMADNKVKIDDLDQFYQRLLQIKFRVKRSIFDSIFTN
jgi:predicted nucleic acid-binding protein